MTYTDTSSQSNYTLILEVWENSTNVSANTSNVGWELRLRANSYYFSGYNVNRTVVVNGTTVLNSSGNVSFSGVGQTITLGSGSTTVSHNADGTKTISSSASMSTSTSPSYLPGNASCSGNLTLSTIPRYATITSFTTPTLTDDKITFDWTSSHTVNAVSWWSSAYDGGTHHDTSASGTSFSQTLTNLPSAKQYDITVAVRRADSNLWTTSSTINVTTLSQNNIFITRIP